MQIFSLLTFSMLFGREYTPYTIHHYTVYRYTPAVIKKSHENTHIHARTHTLTPLIQINEEKKQKQ